MTIVHRIVRATGEVVLTGLSILGAGCIVLVAAAYLFDISLIMFKTGSMSPTIPAGSVAVVREISAPQIQIGDVVTVDRPGQLPVTHRVTSVSDGPAADQRVITMRGDANDADDPDPYTVSTVRIVMFSVPGIAHMIAGLSNPYVLGTITVAASLLVTWAFWPRGPGGPRSSRGDGPRQRRQQTGMPKDSEMDKEGAPANRGRYAAHAVIMLGAATSATLLTITTAPLAIASETEVVHGRYLTLTSIADPEMRTMRPGATVPWQVGISAQAPDSGAVVVSLSGEGDDTLQLAATVTACSAEWADAVCPGRSWRLADLNPMPVDGAHRELLVMPADEERWLLFSVTMAPTAKPASGAGVAQFVHASGHGDTVTLGRGSLPDTGATGPQRSLLLAIGAVIAGLLLAGLGWLLKSRVAQDRGGGE